jgi:hypothetical protein
MMSRGLIDRRAPIGSTVPRVFDVPNLVGMLAGRPRQDLETGRSPLYKFGLAQVRRLIKSADVTCRSDVGHARRIVLGRPQDQLGLCRQEIAALPHPLEHRLDSNRDRALRTRVQSRWPVKQCGFTPEAAGLPSLHVISFRLAFVRLCLHHEASKGDSSMGHRPNPRLTSADHETIARWWRFMFAGVVVVLLALLGADPWWPAAGLAVPERPARQRRWGSAGAVRSPLPGSRPYRQHPSVRRCGRYCLPSSRIAVGLAETPPRGAAL